MKSKRFYTLLLCAVVLSLGWVLIQYSSIPKKMGTVCLFKQLTRLPCPACGSTRAVVCLLQGKLAQSAQINPLGFVVALLLLMAIGGMLFDFINQRKCLFIAYQKMEFIVNTHYGLRWGFVVLMGLNWIWNIQKML